MPCEDTPSLLLKPSTGIKQDPCRNCAPPACQGFLQLSKTRDNPHPQPGPCWGLCHFHSTEQAQELSSELWVPPVWGHPSNVYSPPCSGLPWSHAEPLPAPHDCCGWLVPARAGLAGSCPCCQRLVLGTKHPAGNTQRWFHRLTPLFWALAAVGSLVPARPGSTARPGQPLRAVGHAEPGRGDRGVAAESWGTWGVEQGCRGTWEQGHGHGDAAGCGDQKLVREIGWN